MQTSVGKAWIWTEATTTAMSKRKKSKKTEFIQSSLAIFFSTLFNIHNNGEDFFVYCCFSRNLIYSAAIFSLYFPHKFSYIFFFGVVMFYCAFCWLLLLPQYFFVCILMFNLIWLARYCCFCCCHSINTSRTRHEGKERTTWRDNKHQKQ